MDRDMHVSKRTYTYMQPQLVYMHKVYRCVCTHAYALMYITIHKRNRQVKEKEMLLKHLSSASMYPSINPGTIYNN